MRSIITLMTDFGVSSPYVAQMKGVILSVCREVEIVDITHGIAPQNIREGALILADVTPNYPPGTIHLAVVDPGVGSSRQLIYAEIGQQRYVCPDNGLLSLLVARQAPTRVRAIDNREYWLPTLSNTFHGRDIMAPVVGHLAGGVPPETLGPEHDRMVTLDWPTVQKSSGSVRGEVLYIDSFGNLITNIAGDDVSAVGEPKNVRIDCGGKTIHGIVPAYAAAMAGEIIALIESQNRLEIAKVNGDAAAELYIRVGDSITVTASH